MLGGEDGRSEKKRYQIVTEALTKDEWMEQIVPRRQMSDTLICRWREKFVEGGQGGVSF